VQQMVGFLMTIGTSSMFLSCLTATPQDKYLRKGCPFKGKGLVKICRRTGWLNIDYKAAVERRIAKRLDVPVKDVEYTLGESWHKHVMTEDDKATPVCVNKVKDDGKFYVFMTQGGTKGTRYVLDNGNGDEVKYEDLKEWFYAKGEQDDLKPIVRTVTLNNVSELRARGMIVRTPSTAKAEALLAVA
jgi:hypothetical protein